MAIRLAAFCAAVFLLNACSSQQAASTRTPAPSLQSGIDFPLFPGATIVSARDYAQAVQTAAGARSIFSAGNGTYAGREVIAATSESFAALSAWVGRLERTPPGGWSALEPGGNADARLEVRRYGLDYALFEKRSGGKTRGLLLLAMDPEVVNRRFGRILGMIAKYRGLPAIMRAPLDNEARSRFGMAITQATDPESPIGAALAALGEFQHGDTRGIVLIDAVKR